MGGPGGMLSASDLAVAEDAVVVEATVAGAFDLAPRTPKAVRRAFTLT